MPKYDRQGAILRLVQERALSTQGDVVEALREEGIDAVQATVSRDIHQLGLVKVQERRRPAHLRAARQRRPRPAERPDRGAPPPGDLDRARGAACRAQDAGRLRDAARGRDRRSRARRHRGTVAGENTIFVAPREGISGKDIAELLRHHLEGDGA